MVLASCEAGGLCASGRFDLSQGELKSDSTPFGHVHFQARGLTFQLRCATATDGHHRDMYLYSDVREAVDDTFST